MKTLKERINEAARTEDLTQHAAELTGAKEAKERDIGNWAEFYAAKIVSKIATREGAPEEIDEDMPDLWSRLEKAVWEVLVNTTEVTPDDDTHESRAGRYNTTGSKLEDFGKTIAAAAEVINITNDMSNRCMQINRRYDLTKEANAIMAERVRQAIKAEEETPLEFTIDEKQSALYYLETKEAYEEACEAADKANAEAEDAYDEYTEAAKIYNMRMSDMVTDVDEYPAESPEDLERYLPDTYEAQSLADATEELHDAFYAWKEAHEACTKAEAAQEEAERKNSEAYDELREWVKRANAEYGGYATVSERLEALLDAARMGAF